MCFCDYGNEHMGLHISMKGSMIQSECFMHKTESYLDP